MVLLTQIREYYEILIEEDYLNKIQSVDLTLRPNEMEEILRAKKEIKTSSKLINEVFGMRHALVHEYPANNVIGSIDQLIKYLDSAWLLLMITDRIFAQDINRPSFFKY
jgi:hypothetical protein